MPYTITVISSGQPSANPRLVKEAIALSDSGYNVTVVYVPISPWADTFDERLFHKYPQIRFVKAGYHPEKQKWGYLVARARRKVMSRIFKHAGDILDAADYSTILFGQELLRTTKKHKADLYIAHNLGALPVAVKVARMHKSKVGFDAEDYHRGEFHDHTLEEQQTKYLENKYFPKLDYLSVASPLIGQVYLELFPQINPVVINNVFPIQKLKYLPVKSASTLKLFWFSQTIGKSRGIEDVIKAMGLTMDLPISLTLLGNITPEMKNFFLKLADEAAVKRDKINFIPPVQEDEIFKIASCYDIGIGGELTVFYNREYCLSNKIFTYLIAGNALVLSDTQAQKKFLTDFPLVGSLYKDAISLASIFRRYVENKELLALHQKNARELAVNELNWETESKKLVSIVGSVLSK